MPKFYLEGYGCSLNRADTEAISGFLRAHGFSRCKKPASADFIIMNTCAVKEPTEYRMLNRIGKLWALRPSGASLIVFGCLPKISPKKVSEISSEIVLLGTDLGKLAEFMCLPPEHFSPAVPQERDNKFISILPISRGCLGSCTYCATKNARGKLRSYSPEELNAAFRAALSSGAKEIWLTAQDTGCYGADLRCAGGKPRRHGAADRSASLPELLELLLSNEGDYRVRIGMMNPNHLKAFFGRYVKLLKNKKMYRFIHIPLQSGSERILRLMKRPYTARAFLALAKRLRRELPDVTISTDIIVGFPTETDSDFRKTVSLLKKFTPDIVNISRFGARPDTEAAEMKGQLRGSAKKARSRELSALCREFSLARNRRMLGKTCAVLVCEKGSKGGLIGRTENYKPALLNGNFLGKYVKMRITAAYGTYLEAVPIAPKARKK
ncbi:MAG: tRNA (N(6)-L-threonylcarbamoyladenosine(37)-C(2))-methylthiotransferase [Candidatus Diapherotrites archaeon]